MEERAAIAVLAVAIALLCGSAAASAFDPVYEAKDYSKTLERASIYSTPQYQAKLRTTPCRTAQRDAGAGPGSAAELHRQPLRNGEDGCAGDVRLYDWGPNGYGIVKPVLFTARDGATHLRPCLGHQVGSRAAPGIVITNGSVQADEQTYWYAAQAPARTATW